MKHIYTIGFSLLFALLFTSCSSGDSTKSYSPEEIAAESDRLNAWFDMQWDSAVNRSPIWQSYLGVKKDYDSWGDWSTEYEEKEHERRKALLSEMLEEFDPAKLDAQASLSFRMQKKYYEDEIGWWKYRLYDYPVHQMRGTHDWIPSFLINIHQVADHSDAKAYLKRLSTVDYCIDELIKDLDEREAAGISAPKFVYPHVLDASRNVLKGYPFDDSGEDCPILEDFKSKVANLEDVDEDQRKDMIAQAEDALANVFKPAYEKMIAKVEELEKNANDDAGVWKFKDGDNFYNMALAQTTTTDLTAEEIFEIGMSEVERIHFEMKKIKEQVGKGSMTLQEFFKFIEEDEQFYFSNDEAGREAYLERTHEIIAGITTKLDDLFITKPKATMDVKPVEPFREKTAGKAFYQGPTPDGSRPGRYYVNLYDMTQMPNYQMEALAYHEAIPGHHMQRAIAMELKGLPKFRTLGGGYTSYIEGWGLYSEYIPKQLGFYEDPYSDFGRLSMELWRACRLVVDVGIHYKKWTREKGIEFYSENTPNPYEDCVKMVERHIVMPSQATAYKVGMLKILELRERAEDKLQDKFDVREFHDVVLTFGPVPLTILEENVEDWIASKQS